jgi:4-hydroxyphenylacetate 3-monooxygenase/4-hydroxybutyryl-CoA dehydratase/vinylacetyl-CoA-Delta-isomerase
LTPEDNAYAVSFAIPGDWDGVKLLARPAWVHGARELSEEFQSPTTDLGDVETFIIFDDVFIPRDRVFLNGVENPNATAYGGFLALLFAHYHRHSYTGCKPAISEILASACSLAAEYNNVEKAKHVQTKISHLIGTAELVFAAGESSALHSEKSPSGTQIPDEVLTNAGRRLAGENIYEEYKILADITGGIMATMPYLKTFTDSEVSDLALKYMERNPRMKPEKAIRIIKGIETLGCSDIGGILQVAGLHGGGSPQMETIAMMGRYPMRDLKKVGKYLFGLKSLASRFERSENPVTPREMLKKYRKAMKFKQKTSNNN